MDIPIGRELYSAPFIWVGSDKAQIAQDDRGKYQCRTRFSVAKVASEGGKLTGIRVVDSDTGAVMFSWREG